MMAATASAPTRRLPDGLTPDSGENIRVEHVAERQRLAAAYEYAMLLLNALGWWSGFVGALLA